MPLHTAQHSTALYCKGINEHRWRGECEPRTSSITNKTRHFYLNQYFSKSFSVIILILPALFHSICLMSLLLFQFIFFLPFLLHSSFVSMMLLMLPFTTHHRPTASNSIQVKMTTHKNYVLRIYYKYMHIKLSIERPKKKHAQAKTKQHRKQPRWKSHRSNISVYVFQVLVSRLTTQRIAFLRNFSTRLSIASVTLWDFKWDDFRLLGIESCCQYYRQQHYFISRLFRTCC